MQSRGRKLHAQAAQAREKGEFEESLDVNDRALIAYDADGDILGFAEGLSCRAITLRVWANLTDSKRILTLAKHEMMASVEIARQSGQKAALAVPLFTLAQVLEDLGELPRAVESFKEAVENIQNNPPVLHNRPAVLANMQINLATCEYKAGDKSALARAEDALRQLRASEEQKYNKDVWLSGGFMRIAEMLLVDDLNKAKEYLKKANEIILGNAELTVRNLQWEQLSANFK